MQTERNEIIKQKIADFDAHIKAYWSSLNTEAVWLFLATLGCWSVDNKYIQIYAIVITFILFTQRIFVKLNDKRSFPTIRKEIENTIKTDLEEGDTMKARLHDLHQIRVTTLSTRNLIKSIPMFILCYSFVFVTLVNWWWVNIK